MFNVTGGELVIIFLVALVVLGPERLPEAARTVGRLMGQLKDVSQGFQKELKSAMDEVGEPVHKLTRPSLRSLDGSELPDTRVKPKSAEMAPFVASAAVEPEPEAGWSTPPAAATAAPAPDPAVNPAHDPVQDPAAQAAAPPFAPGMAPAARNGGQDQGPHGPVQPEHGQPEHGQPEHGQPEHGQPGPAPSQPGSIPGIEAR